MTLLIGSLARFPVLFGTIYILSAPPTIATIIAYSSTLFITPVLCCIYLRNILLEPFNVIKNVRATLQNILSAGIAAWIPTLVGVFGSQLGVITVFTVGGAAEASKFYLPLTIFTIALFIVNAINRVGHPLIAGMKTEEERINFVTYSIKIGYIFTMPVVVPLLYFANDFLGLIGNDFASAGEHPRYPSCGDPIINYL